MQIRIITYICIYTNDHFTIEELTEDLNIQPKFNDKDMLLEAYRTYCHFINS